MTTKLLDKKITELTVKDAIKAGLVWSFVSGFVGGFARVITKRSVDRATSSQK